VTITDLRVVDPARPDAPLGVFSQKQVAANLYLRGAKAPTATLGAAQSALVYVDLTVPADVPVPRELAHRLTVRLKEKLGPVPMTIREHVAHTVVDRTPPVVIGPPVEGDRWMALASCTDYHRRTAMAFDGQWRLPERYAVDWIQIDPNHRLLTGDPTRNENYATFGRNVIAVTDGAVVAAVDGMPDVRPGAKPAGITFDTAGGNYVVQHIGGDRYAFYAHLVKGSVRVGAGQRVRRGHVLGLLGNSGNTDGAHLHFHIMDNPSPLVSNGLPYVIDSFVLKGRIVPTGDLQTEAMTGKPIPIGPAPGAGRRRHELPADLTFIEFPMVHPE